MKLLAATLILRLSATLTCSDVCDTDMTCPIHYIETMIYLFHPIQQVQRSITPGSNEVVLALSALYLFTCAEMRKICCIQVKSSIFYTLSELSFLSILHAYVCHIFRISSLTALTHGLSFGLLVS